MNRFEKDFLKECIVLNSFVDDIIEECQREQISLPYTLNRLLKEFIKNTGFLAGFIYTYDEDLNKKFFYKGDKTILEKYNLKMLKDISSSISMKKDDKIIFAQPIDVAGEQIGTLGFIFETTAEEDQTEKSQMRIDIFSEQLDNYLYNNNNSRKKQQLIKELNIVLRNPILSIGIKEAVDILNKELNFKNLAIVYKNIENLEDSWSYKIFEGNQIIFDNSKKSLINKNLSKKLNDMKDGKIESSFFSNIFSSTDYIESTLITGQINNESLGKIFISSNENKGFNTYARDLIEVFSQIMTYRFLDFTKEIKKLRRYFSNETTAELLSKPNYNKTYLMPKIENCLILFTDLNSFTKISEQIFKDPADLGVFIDRWSGEVIDIIYKYNGVFDKMVGDCVIGIFGPPFFKEDKSILIEHAVKAIKEIEEFTISLEDEFPIIKNSGIVDGLGVATGINYASLNVGFFCRYEDYTGFSSGMNNTARLQALAGYRETFIMDNVKGTLQDLINDNKFDFTIKIEDNQHTSVKNVKEPLSYYPISFK